MPSTERLFELLKTSGSLEEIVNCFEIDGMDTELEDESGMTPLTHACWKGNVPLVEFLLHHGADVNGGNHQHGYTSLHFAALAGNVKICKLLLEAGVKVDRINTVNRTAAQMAAFVGQHQCVAVINNFVPKEDVYYFTKKQPLEEKAKLSVELAKPIYDLVMNMNTHPVAVALKVKDSPLLLNNIMKVAEILEDMSNRRFKNTKDINEVLALKFHILHYIIKDIAKEHEKDQQSETTKKTPLIDRWIRSMLIGRENDGFPVFQESFLRRGIQQFPFQDSQLFKVLVTNFGHHKNFGEGLSAAECINQAFNGQKGFKDYENCSTCGEENAMKKCSSCKSVQYCNQTCQKCQWFQHKKECAKLKEKYAK